MRIVGGKHRGRRIDAPPGQKTRPTTDQVRESLFNILRHSGWGKNGASPVDDAHVLDMFCGTGALGLEALSRGAADAVFMDTGREALRAVRMNVEGLGEDKRCLVLRADATRPGKRPDRCAPRDLVFMDPPYGKGFGGRALHGLSRRKWLAKGAILVLEESAKVDIDLPEGFVVLDRRRFGETTVRFFRYAGAHDVGA